MRFPKISSIFLQATSFFLFYNISLCFSLFRLQDLAIKQYYLGSSQIYSLENTAKVRKREAGKSEFIFPLRLSRDDEPFRVLIRKRKSDVVLGNTPILQIFNETMINQSTTKLYMEDMYLYEGYILENPYNTSVNGYLKNDSFYGHLIINNTFYYIDEFNRLNDHFDSPEGVQQERNAVIYTRHDVVFTSFDDIFFVGNVLTKLTREEFHGMFQRWKKNGMLCTLVVVIDYSFLTLIHRGNVDAAMFQVLFSLEEVNANFRSTDFDGDGIADNIGFYVKKIVILSTEQNLYYITKYTKQLVDVNDFIQKFKTYHELEKHCLGIIFTAQIFQLHTLGASFSADNKKFSEVGGVCESVVPGKGSYNSLVITVVTERFNPVPQIIFEITIAHEIGHSFGSSHDPVTNPQCFGHLMSSRTFDDYETNKNRMRFSICSQESILRTLVWKGHCFEPVKTSFCGNGLVEGNEQCDCGMTRDCLEKDPCCVPRRTKEQPCTVNKRKGFECHPSQGECCTSQCKYSSNLKNYVNCKHFEQTCPCANSQKQCSCGINGICIQNECHSIECARLDLNECQCQQVKLKEICSVCCEYKNQCLPVLEVTNKVVNKEEGGKVVSELFSHETKSKFTGKNWVSETFCLSGSKNCAKLHFFQAKMHDYCLMKGKLGRCNQSYDCNTFPSKQVFPSLKSNCRGLSGKLSIANFVFYFVSFRFKNIFF